MLNNKDLGTKIADLRKKKGLTQAQLADLLNISNKTVSRWETGEGYPEITLLSPLARALGVTVDELLAEPAKEMGDDESEPDSDDSHKNHNNGSKPKKHKEIPVEWPEFNFKGSLKTPMVIINVLQIAFFIIFTMAAFSCGKYRTYQPIANSSDYAFLCTAKIGYAVTGIMVLIFIIMTVLYVLSYRSHRISRQLMIRNVAMSMVFIIGIIICYSPLDSKLWLDTSTTIYESENVNFFNCDYFKVNRQIINYVFWGVVLIYLISEIIRVRRIKKELGENSVFQSHRNSFWKSLTIFNKIGLVCLAVCLISLFVTILIVTFSQSLTISITDSAVAVTPAIMLTFISIFPKIGLIITAIGLILGACDLYDRQYKVSIIIIGANLILPYIISFLSVILFIYPYQTLFN